MRIAANDYLDINAREGSYVRYRGDAEVEIEKSNEAKVRED